MRICIIKTSALGDIVQTFPVLHYLVERHPAVQIDWVVERSFMDLLAAHPSIHQVIPVDTKSWRTQLLSTQRHQEMQTFRRIVSENPYDIVFDLQSNLKSGFLTWQVKGKQKVGFCIRSAREWPNILFTNLRYTPPLDVNARLEYLSIVQGYFKDERPFHDPGVILNIDPAQRSQIDHLLKAPELHQKPKILVSGGSAWRNKQLSTETLQKFLRLVQQSLNCSFLLSWGSPEERIEAVKLHEAFKQNSVLLERLSLPMLQNLMSEVDLVIAMDSLPLHLAATTRTPTFGFFGPSLASKFNPTGIQNQAFQGECPYGRSFPRRCPVLRTCPTGACLREQTAEQLFKRWTVVLAVAIPQTTSY